jgi:hypothetical protein
VNEAVPVAGAGRGAGMETGTERLGIRRLLLTSECVSTISAWWGVGSGVRATESPSGPRGVVVEGSAAWKESAGVLRKVIWDW